MRQGVRSRSGRADPVSARLLDDAVDTPVWWDTPAAPAPREQLTGRVEADLVVVGAGLSGLWAAYEAARADPGAKVVLVEGSRIAWSASGRNGGFCAATLTHGLANGADRLSWAELVELDRLGSENLSAIIDTVEREGIDCDLRRSGELDVATEPWQLPGLRESAELHERLGHKVTLLDADETRARVHSPTYLGALHDPDGVVMLDPTRLAWGLAAAAERAGVTIHERTPVTGLVAEAAGVRVDARSGTLGTRRVILATSAFRPLLRRLSAYVVPVHDYVLATRPLTATEWAAVGWDGHEGIGDSGNLFHYYRRTADGRILFGGYDAVYHFGGSQPRGHDTRPSTQQTLAQHFAETFPQLAGVEFTHAWGGVIDTCTRFFGFAGTALGGRVAYTLGHTGLGVGASRAGARTALDLVHGRSTELTRSALARTRPLPFPPEPARWLGITATTASLKHADAHDGRRNLWLRALDAVGLGFDS